MAGITATGFTIKTLDQIITDMRQSIIATVLPYAQFLPNQVITQLIDIPADGLSTIWEGLEALYNASYLTAEGTSLDLVAALQNKRRNEATKASMLDFQVVTSGATTIAAGKRFGSTVPSAPIFEAAEDIEITGAGTHLINVYAVNTGYIEADYPNVLLNTYTQNLDSVANITSVVNNSGTTFVNGKNRESDSSLRNRLQAGYSNSNIYVQDAIRQGILNLNDTLASLGLPQIIDVICIPNNTNEEDADGRPPHSVEIVVYYEGSTSADADSQIADRISIITHGFMQTTTTTGASYSKTIAINGNTNYTATFSRPDEINIYLDVKTVPALTTDQKADLRDYLVEYGNSIGLGKNVVVYGKNSISQALNDYTGVDLTDYVIEVGKTAFPTLSDNIAIANTEISRFATARTIITDL